MSKFNIKKPATTKVKNLAGGFAYKLDVQTELVHAVLTTFLDDKYYESSKERVDRLNDLVAKNKPEFVAKLAVYARKVFHLRSVSTLILGALAKVHRGDDLVKRAIVTATERPDDLTELVALVGAPIPKQVKRGVRNAILKFNRYQLAKYRQEGKGVSLVDLFNLTHPKVQHANAEQKTAWKDLIEGKLKAEDTWEVEISNKENTDKKETWEQLVLTNKMGYMALLRNLNNLVKNGVSQAVIDHAAARLSDKEEVLKSKQLPFRFMTAFDHVKGNRKLTDAIAMALEHSVANLQPLEGKTLIGVDISSSMSGRPMEIASLFAGILAKRNSADIVCFNNRLGELKYTTLSPVIEIANSIRKLCTGGTQTSLVFQYAADKGYNNIIILSDNESWKESYGGGGVDAVYRNLKPQLNNARVFCIDIEGYGTKEIADANVKHISGWSDKVLDYINYSKEGLVDKINQVELNK